MLVTRPMRFQRKNDLKPYRIWLNCTKKNVPKRHSGDKIKPGGNEKMIQRGLEQTRIHQELSKQFINEQFSLRQKKYLQNIDTLYYSILLDINDLEYEQHYSALMNQFKLMRHMLEDGYETVTLNNYPQLHMNGYSFGMYTYDLELQDEILILFCKKQKNDQTPQIIVQLRSYYLWMHGSRHAYEKSLALLKDVLHSHRLKIKRVQENRIDYCWHTNAIQDVERMFRPDVIANMRYGNLRECDSHLKFIGDYDYESDYVRLGKLKSNNIIFRAYLKSKEVVEMGYKPWFFKIWLMNGLISRYDYYCLEECYKKQRWDFLDKARLSYYLEHGTFEPDKIKIRSILQGSYNMTRDELHDYANYLTPKVTKILNFEYMTKRKFYASLKLQNLMSESGIDKDIKTVLDYQKVITDYLTHETLRFVKHERDIRKDRQEYMSFWERLRNTKISDKHINPKDVELVRQYTKDINKEITLDRALKFATTVSVYNNRTSTNIVDDLVDVIASLNDNDIKKLRSYKSKKMNQLKIKADPFEKTIKTHNLAIVDLTSGSIITQVETDDKYDY